MQFAEDLSGAKWTETTTDEGVQIDAEATILGAKYAAELLVSHQDIEFELKPSIKNRVRRWQLEVLCDLVKQHGPHLIG